MLLDKLKQQGIMPRLTVMHHPYLASLLFVTLCFVVTALSIPSCAIWMSLVGGALFGCPWGIMLVVLGGSLGALGAFGLSRYLLRDYLLRHLPHYYQKLDQGLMRHGSNYLLSLRILPIMPFVVLNVLMGLTHISSWRFFSLSLLGITPGVELYVNAGTELWRLQHPVEVLTSKVVLTFLLLALLPWITSWLRTRFKGSES